MMETFQWALGELKQGRKVRRKGWNGKGMWLQMQVPGGEGAKMTLPFVYMKTACDNLVPWVCTQTDLLGEDWEQAEVRGRKENADYSPRDKWRGEDIGEDAGEI